jgi:hypothetical protein
MTDVHPILVVLAAWTAFSLPAGVLVGRLLAVRGADLG